MRDFLPTEVVLTALTLNPLISEGDRLMAIMCCKNRFSVISVSMLPRRPIVIPDRD